jgi:HEAT repeat protein
MSTSAQHGNARGGATRRSDEGIAPGLDEVECAERELADAVARSSDENEVAALVLALGRFSNPRALEPLASLSLHSSAVVRRAIAESLPMTMVVPEESRTGVDALLHLFEDEDAVVRDWAVCSLGRTLAGAGSVVPAPYDTALVRAALTARLDDDDPATRAEACAGLALRHVVDVVEPLRRELASPTVGRVPVIAAESIGSPELYEPLVALRGWWIRDPELLERAIVACSPRE